MSKNLSRKFNLRYTYTGVSLLCEKPLRSSVCTRVSNCFFFYWLKCRNVERSTWIEVSTFHSFCHFGGDLNDFSNYQPNKIRNHSFNRVSVRIKWSCRSCKHFIQFTFRVNPNRNQRPSVTVAECCNDVKPSPRNNDSLACQLISAPNNLLGLPRN